MRNSNPISSGITLTQLLSACAFAVICLWSQPSHARTGLWLWGWLGVADIQLMQETAPGPAPKDAALPPAKPVAAKLQTVDTIKKNASLSKAQSADDMRGKDNKDHALKIIIM